MPARTATTTRPKLNYLLIPSLRAFRFLKDLGTASPRKPRPREPIVEEVTVTSPNGAIPVSVYRPAGKVRMGLMLVPGVTAEGKDDPRLVALAKTMARNGFGVAVPDLPGIRQLVVRASHYQDLVATYQYLLGRGDLAPRGNAGIAGMSFAMGPGVRAALDPAINERIRFFYCVGGYHDLLAQIRFITTGYFREDERSPWQHLAPDHFGRWVLGASMHIHLEDERARGLFRQIVDRRIPDAKADISDLVAELTDPGARALLTLIENTDRDAFQRLFDALPGPMREDLLAMDLSRCDVSALKARLILVHGYEDNIIPYVESLALYRRAPAGRKRLYLINGLGHVTMGKFGPLDAWGLLSSLTALLDEQRKRDRKKL